MAAPRKLSAAASSVVAKRALEFGTGAGGHGGEVPWDAVGEKLAELMRFLASSAQALAAQLREQGASLLAALASLAHGGLAVALLAVAVLLVFVCCCFCVAACQRRRRQSRMDDGEEVEGLGGGDDEEDDYDDGPVVMYRGGRVHGSGPNKPFFEY